MKNRISLVVFICGMVLMALEIAGGRLLVFDYGGNVYVWGSIITVILGGLSIGYYFGGKAVDKKPKETFLSLLILISAFAIVIIPLVYPLLVSLFGRIPSIFAPFIVVFLLFLLPSILLGTVSPFAIKLEARKLEGVGKTSGNLYALSTLGSVVGTFLATFVLILFIPINKIFLLLGVALIFAVFLLKKNLVVYLLSIGIFLFSILIFFFNGPLTNPQLTFLSNSNESALLNQSVDSVFESPYGPVSVKDTALGVRQLFISGGIMGGMYLSDKFQLVPGWEYLDFMSRLGNFLHPREALVLGVGAGIIPMRLSDQYNISVDAVDLNNVVLEVAHNYFGLNPSKNLRIYNGDARLFLQRSNKKYDLIEMDVYKYSKNEYIIPPNLVTKEYFELVKEHLNSDGVFMVMVVLQDVDSGKFNSIYSTIRSVFKNVYVFDDGEMIIVASDKNINFTSEFSNKEYSKNISPGMIYTDQYVPVVSY